MNNDIKINNSESNEKISKSKQNDQFYFNERNQSFINYSNYLNNKINKNQLNKYNKLNYNDRTNHSRIIFNTPNYLIPPLTRIGSSDKSSSDSSDGGSEKNLINNKTSFSLSKRKPIGNLTPTKFDYLNERKLKRSINVLDDNNSIKSNLDSNLSDQSSKSINQIDKYSNKSTNKLLSQNSSNRSTPDLPINQRSHCSINHLNKENLFNNNLKQFYSSSNLFDSYQNIYKFNKFSSTFTLPIINSNLILSTKNLPKNAKTSGFIIGSSIYGQLIVVICLVLFTAEICTSLPLHYFEIFFFYLYSISIIFLFYVYIYLLRGVKSNDLHARENKIKKDKVSENENSYGSIFLRIGCIVFGLGSMIYNSLELGSYFEFGIQSPCHSIFLLLNPLLQLIFTFFQMYFIFTYSRLMINRFKIIARIGLIHLVATNVCTWIKILLKETLQTLHFNETISSHSTLEELILPIKIDLKNQAKINGSLTRDHHSMNISNPCYPKEIIMGDTLSQMSTYLYPFIVEYSLIGAAFLYVMWCHIGKLSNLTNYNKSNLNYNSQHLHHHSNRQQTNCPHLNNHQQDVHEKNINQRSRSGSISPSLSVNHLNNIDNNQVLFNTTTNQIETNLNHNLLDTNSSNCSPTNQTTNTSITPTSTNDNTNLITNVQCTPPTNRSVLMINTQLTNPSNYIQSNQTMNATNNAVLLDNISIGSSHDDSFNGKFSGNLSYQVNSMYTNNLLNSTQSLYSCLGSSRGLFCGFLFLVCSIVSLIIFFVLFHHANYMFIASLINESSHSFLLILSSISIIIAYFKIRKLKFQPGLNETADGGLRDLLLRVAAFGLYTYSLFGLIAGSLNLNNIQNIAVFVTSILSILQISLQSLFINDIVCRKRTTSKQQVPQQIITFLIIINFIFWILYSFEFQKIEASPVQLQVYGRFCWGIVVRLTLPLSIFYRFHSAITLAEIHKNIVKS